jgi:hypothetical protein
MCPGGGGAALMNAKTFFLDYYNQTIEKGRCYPVQLPCDDYYTALRMQDIASRILPTPEETILEPPAIIGDDHEYFGICLNIILLGAALNNELDEEENTIS